VAKSGEGEGMRGREHVVVPVHVLDELWPLPVLTLYEPGKQVYIPLPLVSPQTAEPVETARVRVRDLLSICIGASTDSGVCKPFTGAATPGGTERDA